MDVADAAFVSLAFLVGFSWIQSLSIRDLTIANRIPTFWRSVHLFSGVSGLLPQLFLIAGLYCWFWFSLRGIAVFGNDRPILSKKADLKLASGTRIMPMFSQREAGKPTEDWALTFGRFYLVLLGGIFLVVNVLGAVLLGGKGPFPGLRRLGEQKFGRYIFTWVALCISLILADSVQAWATWSRLRDLLTNLDRLPLRRTQFALQGLSWRSMWAMCGNVLTERYSLVSRQIEAMRHLGNQLELWIPGDSAEARI